MRLVDIEPFIEVLDKSIQEFMSNKNGLGAGIFTNLKNGLLNLPVVKVKKRRTRPMSQRIVCLVGPSGSGKTAICNALLAGGGYVTAVSDTTRPIRPGEVPDKSYHFITPELFQIFSRNGMYMETTSYNSHNYGLRANAVDEALMKGQHVVLVLDINGAKAVKSAYPDKALIVYVSRDKGAAVSSVLERNVSQEEIISRLRSWDSEKLVRKECDYVLDNNGPLEDTILEFTRVMKNSEEIPVCISKIKLFGMTMDELLNSKEMFLGSDIAKELLNHT